MGDGVKNHRVHSETILGASLYTVGVCYTWVKPKPCCIGIGVEECIEVEILEDVWVLQGTEVKAESRGLGSRLAWDFCKERR